MKKFYEVEITISGGAQKKGWLNRDMVEFVSKRSDTVSENNEGLLGSCIVTTMSGQNLTVWGHTAEQLIKLLEK